MVDKQYPTDPAGREDRGADAERRFRPCTKDTWCKLGENHAGECEVVNRPAKTR